MKITLLENEEQFKKLFIEDYLLVKWSDYFVKHHPASRKVMSYQIELIKGKEIILQTPENHYINYSLYLENKSNAEEVYYIEYDTGIVDKIIDIMKKYKANNLTNNAKIIMNKRNYEVLKKEWPVSDKFFGYPIEIDDKYNDIRIAEDKN